MQHDCLSWQVMGTEFEKVPGVSERSRELNNGLKSWLAALTMEERKEIIELIFNSLSQAQIRTIGDFAVLTPGKIYDMMRNLKEISSEQKSLINRALRMLMHALKGK